MSDADFDRKREDRQLRLMLDRLHGFQRGEVRLAKAVSDLEGLLAVLESVPEEWRRSFVREWGQLEIAYALALDGPEPMADASDPEIGRAVKRMIKLVEDRLVNRP